MLPDGTPKLRKKVSANQNKKPLHKVVGDGVERRPSLVRNGGEQGGPAEDLLSRDGPGGAQLTCGSGCRGVSLASKSSSPVRQQSPSVQRIWVSSLAFLQHTGAQKLPMYTPL